jgi:hypothetical protein
MPSRSTARGRCPSRNRRRDPVRRRPLAGCRSNPDRPDPARHAALSVGTALLAQLALARIVAWFVFGFIDWYGGALIAVASWRWCTAARRSTTENRTQAAAPGTARSHSDSAVRAILAGIWSCLRPRFRYSVQTQGAGLARVAVGTEDEPNARDAGCGSRAAPDATGSARATARDAKGAHQCRWDRSTLTTTAGHAAHTNEAS